MNNEIDERLALPVLIGAGILATAMMGLGLLFWARQGVAITLSDAIRFCFG